MSNVSKLRHAYVVDDHRPARESLSLLLLIQGWEVSAFATAHECLRALPGRPPDCLITDLQMPRMGGAELLERVRELPVRVPSIVVTGLPLDAPEVERARLAGAQDVLRKPYTAERMETALRAAVTAPV
jgi:two-component system, LuxR family, response regulator FixJ